jgi:acetyltransferase-like isoleucine patch superfamily enzyme
MSNRKHYWQALFDLGFYSTLLSHTKTAFATLLAEHQAARAARSERSPEKARLRLRKDVFVSDYENLNIGEGVEIDRDVRIIVPSDGSGKRTNVTLGKRSFLGRQVSLGGLQGSRLTIGDYTTINENCVILGDVCVERYCTFSMNIFISSGNHYSTLFPTWLIKDQDSWVQNNEEYAAKHSRPVHIEEDCWLGWGVFVKQGIYIGRGAVIGAYSVVTRDVPPYSVQIGAPNREIAKRFDFQPPRELTAVNERHWPYFYAGFLMRQEEISLSRDLNLLFAGPRVRLILGGGVFDLLVISGQLRDGINELKLAVACNGIALGEILVKQRSFSERLAVIAEAWNPAATTPSVLRDYNEIELRVISDERAAESAYFYGIASISLHAKN